MFLFASRASGKMRGHIFILAFYAFVGLVVLSFELILAEEIAEIPITTEGTNVKESLEHSIFTLVPHRCSSDEVLVRGRCRKMTKG
jgi:hypothetical protein